MMKRNFVVNVIGMIATMDAAVHHMKRFTSAQCICTIIRRKLKNLIKRWKNGNGGQKVRDVLMWKDEREERLQEIKQDLAGLALYTIVWAALFAVVWIVMF